MSKISLKIVRDQLLVEKIRGTAILAVQKFNARAGRPCHV